MVPARRAFFDPFVGDWTGKRVLDLGCGGGFMAEALSARGAVVTVSDPSAEAIAAGRVHSAAMTFGSIVLSPMGMSCHSDRRCST
jgi:2-polyprenyl-6-hydroxyphenyl methylase/3-demethylubiquinone-9 3-methyltransferase